jgi:hypothetical protein
VYGKRAEPEEVPEDEDELMPVPEDYIKTPCGRLGSKTCVGEVEGDFLGEFDSEEEADKAICEKMEKERFWPTVWFLSDHGNLRIETDFKCTLDLGGPPDVITGMKYGGTRYKYNHGIFIDEKDGQFSVYQPPTKGALGTARTLKEAEKIATEKGERVRG